MKALLVCPEYGNDFWTFDYALEFVSKQADQPPLGLLTVASMFPADWELKLVDMNVTALTDEDIGWADYVFIGAMVAQRDSAKKVIARCRDMGRKTVGGGWLFSTIPGEFPDVDHLVLNEAESSLPSFIKDLTLGCAKRIYSSDTRPDLSLTPLPRWSLIDMSRYTIMNMQYSRGCPFNCDFCQVSVVHGRGTRAKTPAQVIAELDAFYHAGWRGAVFIVDDNFIGNRKAVKAEVLPAMISWQKERRYPLEFLTQVSIDLADDRQLMGLLAEAGFNLVLIGIESPNRESLAQCGKSQNLHPDLVEQVKSIQRHGLETMAGFIVGFDADPPAIFRQQIDFIQQSGIPIAMVGLLNAPPGTRLYRRLEEEGRIREYASGSNTDGVTNIVPKMGLDTLVDGYRLVMRTIYEPQNFYARVWRFLKEFRPYHRPWRMVPFRDIAAFLRTVWRLGIRGRERGYYWRLLLWVLFRRPELVATFIALAIKGYHFRMFTESWQSGSPA